MSRNTTTMTIYDVGHYTDAEREQIVSSYPAHEREARAKGIPVLGSGRIFPVEESLIQERPIAIPKHWARLVGIDIGWDHPTAAVWGAWDRDVDVVHIYDAYKVREQPVAVHAAALRARGVWIPVAWPHDALQHDKGAGIELAKQYRDAGVNMLRDRAQYPEQVDARDETMMSRVSVEAGVSDMLDRMLTGRLKVADHLSEWFDEFRLYHRKNGKIVKEFDDLMSATRYLLMMLRYAITEQPRNDIPQIDYSPALSSMGY